MQNNYIRLFVIFVCLIALSACNTTMVEKETAFPNMYLAKPSTILVVPAVNNSTAAEATEYFSTTVAEPLSRMGYYVMPTELTNRLLLEQGIVDGAQLENTNPKVFKELYGADAIMMVTINKWDTSYYVIGGNVSVGIAYKLISTTDQQVLWQYSDTVVVDTGGGNSGGGLIGAIIATAINTSLTDYVPLAKRVNYTAMSSLPFGRYHEKSGTDQQIKAVDLTKVSN